MLLHMVAKKINSTILEKFFKKIKEKLDFLNEIIDFMQKSFYFCEKIIIKMKNLLTLLNTKFTLMKYKPVSKSTLFEMK